MRNLRDVPINELRTVLRSHDPFDGITIVGDRKLLELAEDVANCLHSDDPMVRWNATVVLTTRLKSKLHAESIHSIALSEKKLSVRAAALAGLGDLIPLVSSELRERLGETLLQVLANDAELIEMRGAAYESILAALGVPPPSRPSAAKLIDLDTDVDKKQVAKFKRSLRIGF